MKQLFQLSLTALLLSSTCSFAVGQTTKTENKSSTPEEVSMTIISDLSKKDYAAYSNLIMSKEELVKLINASTSADKEKSLAKADDASKKILSDSKKNFDKTIADIEAEGILIDQINYKSCKPEIKNKNGNECLNLQIVFDFKGNEYTVFCRELFKPANGWKVTGNLHLKKEQKSSADAVPEITEDAEKDNSASSEPSKISFYTDEGKKLITEGDGATLRSSKDLSVKISFTNQFLKYDKVIVWYGQYAIKNEKKVEVACGDYGTSYSVEFKRGEIKNKQDIFLWLMKPGAGKANADIVNASAEGRGDFMEYQNSQYAWVYITSKHVLPSKGALREDLFQGITVKGYKKTGTETKEYYDSDGKLVKETYAVYDDGTTIVESNEFVIKATK